MPQEKAERITITLPPEMLASIRQKVNTGSYGSTSELIREAMRLWQKKEAEYEARISLIRQRLEQSTKSGEPLALNAAFGSIEELHERRMQKKS